MDKPDELLIDHRDKGSYLLSVSDTSFKPDTVFVIIEQNAVVLDKSEVDDLITWLQYWRLMHE